MNQFSDFQDVQEGSSGPWMIWAAKETNDGVIPSKSFYVRSYDEDSKETTKTVFDGFKKGVVLDIRKVGWQFTTGDAGVAPVWDWADTLKLQLKPGDGYKKGFQAACAIGGGEVVMWEQSGAAVWTCLNELVPALREGPNGKLPLVKLTGSRFEKYPKGSTNIPILEVVKWVDRPDCLKPDAIDTGTQEQAKQPDPAPVDDDMSF